jgi:hypothetical protein
MTVVEHIAAAYACDAEGRETDAVVHYDAAWRLGVPAEGRAQFLLGYGSTLRNVGRLDDSLAILRAATAEFPDDQAMRVFLALTLHSTGAHSEALATMFDVALALADPTITKFRRSIGEYREELSPRRKPTT